MDRLTVNDIFNLVNKLWKNGNGMNYEDIMKLPIYIGNDEELNGIHTAYFVEKIDKNTDDDDEKYLVDLINEDCLNSKLEDKGILIS